MIFTMKGHHMTRLETIKQSRYDQILKVMLTTDEIDQFKNDYVEFINHDHKLPSDVIKIILIKSIIFTKNKGRLPNAAYMRKVAESFRSTGATTLAKAIDKMDRDKEFAMKRLRNNDPNWMDDYEKELEAMEEHA
jgi:replication initiation and membrane attachment protein DnaB